MAIVKLSALFSDISGTVGNLTFSRTTGGLAVRKKRSQYSDFTDTFYDWSTRMSHFGSQWKLLTEEQRIQWNNAAKEVPRSNRVGDQKTISGINYFCSVNTNRYMVGETKLEVPPVLESLSYIIRGTFSLETSDIMRVRLVVPVNSRTTSVLVKVTPPLSAGIMRNYNYDQLNIYPLPPKPPSYDSRSVNLKGEYGPKYGYPTLGEKVFVEAFLIDHKTGHKYSRFTASAIKE